jgi:hypothetical protein
VPINYRGVAHDGRVQSGGRDLLTLREKHLEVEERNGVIIVKGFYQ